MPTLLERLKNNSSGKDTVNGINKEELLASPLTATNNEEISRITTAPKVSGSAAETNADFRMSEKDYDKYTEYGAIPGIGITEEDLNRERAKNQSVLEQFGRFAGQLAISEVLLGTIRGFSDLFDSAVNLAGFSKDNDFTNPLSEALANAQNSVREDWEIYRKEPDKNFAFNDFGWYMNGLVSMGSTLSLLIPSTGIAKGVSWLGKLTKLNKVGNKVAMGAAKGLKAVGVTDKVARTATKIKQGAEVGSMALMSRIGENYIEARDVYTSVLDSMNNELSNMSDNDYKTFIENNPQFAELSKEEIAKKIASEAGHNTYVNDMYLLAMDIPQFKSISNIWKGIENKAFTGAVRKAQSESIINLAKKTGVVIDEKAVEKSLKSKFLKGLATDIKNPLNSWRVLELGEGIEEGWQGIQQQRGEELVNIYTDPNYTAKTAADYLTDGSIWDQAFWGVIGGIGFKIAGGGLGKFYNRLENNYKKKAGKITQEQYDALELGENVARVNDINNRFNLMNNYVEQMRQIAEHKNPFETKEGSKELANTISEEQENRLRKQVTDNFVTDIAINAAENGNYDLLKEFVSSKEFNKYYEQEGIQIDSQLEQSLIKTMDKVVERYNQNLFDFIDNTDIVNNDIARISAKSLTRLQNKVDRIREEKNQLNIDSDIVSETELLNQSLDDIINENLIAINRQIADLNSKRGKIDTNGRALSEAGYQSRLKELNEAKEGLLNLAAQNTIGDFQAYIKGSGIKINQETIDEIQVKFEEFYKPKVFEAGTYTNEQLRKAFARANLYVDDAIYSSWIPKGKKELQKYFEDIESQVVTNATSRYGDSLNRVIDYINRAEDTEKAINDLLNDTNISRRLHNDMLTLKIGANNRETINSLFNMAIQAKLDRQKRNEANETKVENDGIETNSSTGSSTESTPATSTTSEETITPPIEVNVPETTPISSPVKEEQSDEVIDNTSESIEYVSEENQIAPEPIIDENEVESKPTAEEKKVLTEEAEMFGNTKLDIKEAAYQSSFNILIKHKELYENLLNYPNDNVARQSFIDAIISDLVSQGYDKAEAEIEAPIALSRTMYYIQQRAESVNSKAANKVIPALKQIIANLETIIHQGNLDVTSNRNFSRFDEINDEDSIKKLIEDTFKEYLNTVGRNHIIKNGKELVVIDMKDVINYFYQQMRKNETDVAKQITLDDFLIVLEGLRKIARFQFTIRKNVKTKINFAHTESLGYSFRNIGYLNNSASKILDDLYNAATSVEISENSLHIQVGQNATKSPTTIRKSIGQKIFVKKTERWVGAKKDPASLSFVDEEDNEIGFVDTVNRSADGNTYRRKGEYGFRPEVTKTKEGIESNIDGFIYELIQRSNKDYQKLFDFIANPNTYLQGDALYDYCLELLNSPIIKPFIEDGTFGVLDINTKNKSPQGKNELINKVKKRIISPLNGIIFYNYRSQNNKVFLDKESLYLSYYNYIQSVWNNYNRTYDLQTQLEDSGKVDYEITLQSLDSSELEWLYDSSKENDIGNLGLGKAVREKSLNGKTRHPVIMFTNVTEGVDENGNHYNNPATFMPGSYGMVLENKNGSPIVALFNGTNKVAQSKELYKGVYNELTKIVNDYFAKKNKSSIDFDNLYNQLSSIFSYGSNSIFKGIIISKDSTGVHLLRQYKDKQGVVKYERIITFKKFADVTYDSKKKELIDSKGKIVLPQDEASHYTNQIIFYGKNKKINARNKNESISTGLNLVEEIIAENLEFNMANFAFKDIGTNKQLSQYVTRNANGSIQVNIGEFNHLYESYSDFLVSNNAVTTSHMRRGSQGTVAKPYNFNSLFVKLEKTTPPKINESHLQQSKTTAEKIVEVKQKKSITSNELLDTFKDELNFIGIDLDKIKELNQKFADARFDGGFIPNEVLIRPRSNVYGGYITKGKKEEKGKIFIGRLGLDQIQNKPKNLLRELIHEQMHRVTDKTDFFKDKGKVISLVNTFNEFKKSLETYDGAYAEILRNFADNFSKTYTTDIQIAKEWVSEVFSQSVLMQYLNTVPVGKETAIEYKEEHKSLLQKIIDAILDIFGIDKSKNNTIFTEIYNILGDDTGSTLDFTSSIQQEEDTGSLPIEELAEESTDTIREDNEIKEESNIIQDNDEKQQEEQSDIDDFLSGFTDEELTSEAESTTDETDDSDITDNPFTIKDDEDFSMFDELTDSNDIAAEVYAANPNISLNGISRISTMGDYVNRFEVADRHLIQSQINSNELNFHCR